MCQVSAINYLIIQTHLVKYIIYLETDIPGCSFLASAVLGHHPHGSSSKPAATKNIFKHNPNQFWHITIIIAIVAQYVTLC